jgi:hypothetical protein
MDRRRRGALVALAGLAAGAVLPVAAASAQTLPQRRGIARTRGDLFGERSWAPPAPSAPVVQQPTEAAPPPNPYRFAGTAFQDGRLKTYLVAGDRLYEVREGEALDHGYRVESLSRESIVLVYVPLGTKQRIEVDSQIAR